MIKTRLVALRAEMSKEKIDFYIIPTSDFHKSEYVGEYFRAREFMSGFTGSAGTLVVSAEEAGLFTDGRYFLQAEEQLAGSTIELFRMGEENVPTIEEYLKKNMPEGGVLGFDGRVIDTRFGCRLKEILSEKGITINFKNDLVDRIWQNRPAISTENIFIHDIKYSGCDASEKLTVLREKMSEKNADCHILTSLDDIAWLFNLRGSDVPCNPVFLSYAAITQDEALLFVNDKAVTDTLRAYLSKIGVTLKAYNDIYNYAAALRDCTVLIDPDRLNYSLLLLLEENVKLVKEQNPTTFLKSIKNETEIKNLKETNIKDGVAVTKFLYYLDKNIGKTPMTELTVVDLLRRFREEQEGFSDISFDTIAGYGAHGAIIHYEPTEESDIALEPHGFLLIDSGAQFPGGTTDITRTIALGPVTDEMKKHYTAVLRANLNLSSARFLEGCTGANLDILARQPFWDNALDYNHGTGHGLGFFLNVHEGPQGFHWRVGNGRNSMTVLKEGMVITDEPGIYIAGSHGIRLENDILCKKDIKNEYGQFMCFEVLTLAPFDLKAVNFDEMSEKEIAALNSYHELVRNSLAPYLTVEENEWLREATEINR